MKIINSAADCSIRAFISCRFRNNFEPLLIEGEATQDELRSAFNAVLMEYCDTSGNTSEELNLDNKVKELFCRNCAVDLSFRVIDTAIEINSEQYILEVIPRLKKNGISIKWNNDIEDFKKQVNNAKTRDKRKHVELKELQDQLETLRKQSTSSKSYTLEDFYRELNILESAGYKIDEDKTNMARLAIMRKDYIEAVGKQSPN